jgi:hypothetical protein
MGAGGKLDCYRVVARRDPIGIRLPTPRWPRLGATWKAMYSLKVEEVSVHLSALYQLTA